MHPLDEQAEYRPADLELVVMTVSREPQYVHQTLASLFVADPAVRQLDRVWLMVGSDDAGYLRRYRHHEKLRIEPVSPEEAGRIRGWNIHRRFNYNYLRCLSVPLEGRRGVVIVEDDVVFRDDFLSRLLTAIREMEVKDGLRQYALALFSAYDFESDPSFYRGRHYCSYGYPFYGTPAMYYPATTCKEIAAWIRERGVERCEDAGDLLVKHLYGNRMYACPRALAQHVGEVSTGLGGGGGALSFDRPYRPIPPEDWGRKC